MTHPANTPAQVFVAYCRVSTQQQGVSGLGLESQQAIIKSYVERVGGTLHRVFVEVESGRKSNRPELRAALAEAAAVEGSLIVAKLDRLARNVGFLSQLLDAGVEFTAVDTPSATRTTLQLLMVVAEGEARSISERTRAALKAAKDRGQQLGNNGKYLDHAASVKGARVMAMKARQRYALVGELIIAWRAQGKSYATIAAELNGLRSEVAGQWSATKVARVEKYTLNPVSLKPSDAIDDEGIDKSGAA